ncbi:MAG: hypothetical protein LBD27_04460 [Tannerella sp.]|jgi:hypothetical protein|nr:hypothetical protein [Tannerella sp.]
MKKVFVSGCYDMAKALRPDIFFVNSDGHIPLKVSPEMLRVLEKCKPDVQGWKLSGGGYFVFVSEYPVDNAIQIRIRK